eukprot:441594_1
MATEPTNAEQSVNQAISKAKGIDEKHSMVNNNCQCICKVNLQKANDASCLYQGSGVCCDECGISGKKGDIFWHCETGKNEHHPNGFDICNNCSRKYEYCDYTTHTCISVMRLIQILTEYNQAIKCEFQADEQAILNIINDFIHSMYFHNDDEQFEFIVNKLGYCDMIKCQMLKRNHGAGDLKVTDNTSIHDTVYMSILDKIHCYFMHCFDIGNRLMSKEKALFENDNIDEKQLLDSQDLIHDHSKIIKINEILQPKHSKYKEMSRQWNDNRMSKNYNQIFSEPTKIDTKQYNYGYKFKYGYPKERCRYSREAISVKPKYSSIKEEVTKNKICILNMNQFNKAYSKSQLKFNSYHCKKTYQ